MPVDRVNLLTLAVPEMIVLLGGMRALNANAGQSEHGVFTDRSGTLSNDFFVNLSDMPTRLTKSSKPEGVYEERDRGKGKLRCTATPSNLSWGRISSCALPRKSRQRTTHGRSL
jgi:catalase-peroxidase